MPEAKHKIAEEMMSCISSIKRETALLEEEYHDLMDIDLVEVLLLTLPHLDTILFYTI